MLEAHKKHKAAKIFNKGQDYLRTGSLTKAYKCYEIAYLNGYAQNEAFFGMGCVCLYQLNLYTALEHFNRVLIHADSTTGVNYYIGLCYYYFGSDNEAYEHFYKALKSSRNHLIRLQAFEFLDERKQLTDEDRSKFLKDDLALNIEATLDKLTLNLCKAYLDRINQDLASSTVHLEELVDQYPTVYQIYAELGKNYALQKDYQTALTHYAKAIQYGSEDLTLYYDVAKILYQLKDYYRCRRLLKRLSRTITSNYKLYYNLANACYKLEKFSEAQKYYRLAVESNPNSFKTFYNLATVNFKMGNFNTAEANYRIARTINKTHSGTYYNLGILYFMQKQYFEAIHAFMTAHDLNESNPHYFHNLSVAKGIKLIDPKEKIQHRIPLLINILLFSFSVFLVILIIYFLQC